MFLAASVHQCPPRQKIHKSKTVSLLSRTLSVQTSGDATTQVAVSAQVRNSQLVSFPAMVSLAGLSSALSSLATQARRR